MRTAILSLAALFALSCSARTNTMATAPWASDANYPAGSDPWSSEPTKVAPLPAEIAAGHTPGVPVPAETENWWKNRADTRLAALEAQYASRVGRIETIHRNWLTQAESITLDGTGTTLATLVGNIFEGAQLHLQTASGGEFARGHFAAVMIAPMRAPDCQVLEWDVDATLVGANQDLFMGIGELGFYDNGKGGIGIYKSQAKAVWSIIAQDQFGGTVELTDTAVVVSAVAAHRMRIEWIGSGYAGGARANFYIDDVLVHTSVNLPINAADSMYLTFDLQQAGAVGGTVHVSPFTWRHARTVADGAVILVQ